MTKYLCAIIETLLGRDHMEELYFHADLHTLFKELSEYSSPRKTYNFLIQMDEIFKLADNQKYPNPFRVNELYENIIFYLAECFLTKFRIMYLDGELNNEDYDLSLGYINFFMNQNLTFYKVIKSRKLGKYLAPLQIKVNNKVNKSRA